MKFVPGLREAVARRARRVPAITGLLARYRKGEMWRRTADRILVEGTHNDLRVHSRQPKCDRSDDQQQPYAVHGTCRLYPTFAGRPLDRVFIAPS